jgi:hypothetical protein
MNAGEQHWEAVLAERVSRLATIRDAGRRSAVDKVA